MKPMPFHPCHGLRRLSEPYQHQSLPDPSQPIFTHYTDMSLLQLAAYASNFVLILCAWRMPKVRLYAGTTLCLDLIRLALQHIPSQSLALYAADGLLITLGPIVLAWCLGLNPMPFLGLGLTTVGLALSKVHGGDKDALTNIYASSLFASHTFTTIGAISSREWRRNFNVESLVLIGLSAVGSAGAITVIAWGEWDLVCTSNVVAYVALAILCLFLGRDDDRV